MKWQTKIISTILTLIGIVFGISFFINIITIQSYPFVGNPWVTDFDTVGMGDLKITPINGTSFKDLEFVSLKCGDNIIEPDEITDSYVKFDGYYCFTKNYFEVKVLSTGVHTLMFEFGNEIDYSYNNASFEKEIVYKNNNMTIEFKEGSITIGQATLKSHITYDEIRKVTTGKNRTVIWYEFSDFKDIKIEALKGVEFIDMREMIVNDSKEYKEFEEHEIISNPDYLLQIEKDYHLVYLNDEEWLDYNSFEIPKENIIIGVQTDLRWGEYLDVRFNVFDNKLDRHAVVVGVNSGFVTVSPSGDPAGSSLTVDLFAFANKDTTGVGITTITEIGWYTDTATEEANYEVAIYTHDAGNDRPENRLAGASFTNAKGTDAGWKKVTGLSISVSASTIYWIAVSLQNTATATKVDYSAIGGERLARLTATENLPDPWAGSPSENDNLYFAVYAVAVGPDETPPIYSDNSTNSTINGTYIKHSLKWTDNSALDGYIFSFDNGTGTMINDSWVSMKGTQNWSNVTKWINSTLGATIEWCVHANDTTDNWNSTSCVAPFSYVTTAAPEDTCTCPGDSTAHEFDCSDICNVTSCTAGAVNFTGSGTVNCNGTWNIDSLGDPGSGCILYIDSNCYIDE